MGLICCARLWSNLWRHQRKQRCWTSVVAFVLKGYTFQRFVQLAPSVCLCLLEYCRGEIRVVSICRLVLLFTSSSYITRWTTTTATKTATTAAAVVTITIMVHGSTLGWDTALQARRLWVQFPMVYTEFFIHLIFLAALWALGFKPGVNNLMSTIKTQGLLIFSYGHKIVFN